MGSSCTFDPHSPGSREPGWSKRSPPWSNPIIRSVTPDTSQAKITVTGVADRPGVAASLFRKLADAGVNVDMIVQNASEHGETDISFTVPRR